MFLLRKSLCFVILLKSVAPLPSKEVACPPISFDSINIKCSILYGPKQGILDCKKPLPVDAIAEYECKVHYMPVNGLANRNKNAICQKDGRWSRDYIACEPVCGKRDSDAVALIVHGWEIPASHWPWHAVLYLKTGGKWTFSCGGTLISEKTVITAAHCTWKTSINYLKVAFGKSFSDFDRKEDFTQMRNVEKIIIPASYQDITGNYNSDISMIVLDEPVAINEFIRPICLDWDGLYVKAQLANGNKGLTVGMGINENDTFSNELRATFLPVVSYEDCIKNEERAFKKYVTYTTFCAGWNNGTGVCNGDSGGGIAFQNPDDKDQWFLQGIVSMSPRRHGTSFCDTKHYTVFTKLAKYMDWLQDVFAQVHPERLKKVFKN